MKQAVILGNLITMDEKRPFAKAALVKDGLFAYIGGAAEAKKLADTNAQVLDYGENFIYPGFLESHCHGHMAGDRAIGQANLAQVLITDYAKYREVIEKFIADNPDCELYFAAGWIENEEYVSKAYLDDICSDKPLIMQTGGGHSMLLNTKALEWAGIDAQSAKKYGYDLVHVDKNGEPDGYICEAPVFDLAKKIPTSIEDAKKYLLAWQDVALENGYTAVADAGVELFSPEIIKAYYELEAESKLKLRTYAYLLVLDNPDDPKGSGMKSAPRNIKEAITREQFLRAMTINVARQWHQEHRLGSIEFGKLANMTVFNCDFLHDDLDKVAKAKIIATIVDGGEVYKND